MQLIQAGKHQIVVLEFDHDLLRQGAQETGFEIEIDDQPRVLNVLLRAPGRDSPLLLFDASDPANTGGSPAARSISTDAPAPSCRRRSLWPINWTPPAAPIPKR